MTTENPQKTIRVWVPVLLGPRICELYNLPMVEGKYCVPVDVPRAQFQQAMAEKMYGSGIPKIPGDLGNLLDRLGVQKSTATE